MIGGIVVMGVSGCGKSTLGRALANAIGAAFIEGDDCHPPANVAKMAAGIPLTDDDRRPFLENVAGALRRMGWAVASCSALKRQYRDLLRAEAGPLVFVLPSLAVDDLDVRLRSRPGHFMPPSLLASQIATLELPGPDEDSILVPGSISTGEQVIIVRRFLAAREERHRQTGG